jgi:aminoglycoside 6'-N-acetyltransferase
MLKTPRLLLRPFRDLDLDAFAEYRSDPEVARYQSWTPPYTKDQAIELIRGMEGTQPGTPGQWLQLAVERQSQPGIIGDCAFQVFADDPRQAQIGYTFSRSYQKQGYATEAVRCLLGYLFGELHLHRVVATCDAENMASFRLLERVGMRREAWLVENIWFKGGWGSEYKYAILNKEWDEGHYPTIPDA